MDPDRIVVGRVLERLWIMARAALRRARAEPFETVLAIVSALFVWQLVFTVLVRMRYPFELEWMEGGVVDHIRIVLLGQPLYRAPSLDFTPYIYTPFYYYVCALLSRVLGVGFFVPRLVSTLSMIGSMALIARFVRREGGSRLAALVSVGLFAATFERSGFWMDLARVDSLFTVLVLLGAYLARHGRSSLSAVSCGVVLFLAFFTKQTGLVLALPILAGAIAFAWRRGLLTVGVFVLLMLVVVRAMDASSDGWFSYYVFTVPRQHGMRWSIWSSLLIEPFWSPMVIPLLLLAFAFFSSATSAKGGRRVGWFFGALFLVALLASYSSLLHADGFANVLIPFYAITSLLAGIGLDAVLRVNKESTSPPLSKKRVSAFVVVALLLHFAVIAYDHRHGLPSRRDVSAGQAMISMLRERPGPLLMLGTGYYGAMAGHPEVRAQTMALSDVFKTQDDARKDTLLRSIIDEIRSKRFSTIVLDPSSTAGFLPESIVREVRQSYRLEAHLFPAEDAAATWPRTGFASRPDEVWVPR